MSGCEPKELAKESPSPSNSAIHLSKPVFRIRFRRIRMESLKILVRICIRIRIGWSEVRIRGSGSVPKCQGSCTHPPFCCCCSATVRRLWWCVNWWSITTAACISPHTISESSHPTGPRPDLSGNKYLSFCCHRSRKDKILTINEKIFFKCWMFSRVCKARGFS